MSAEIAAHMLGDYVLQSDYMANTKTKSYTPAFAHSVTYAAAFIPITRDPRRLAVIAGTHFVIDRWRLARHVVWLKNQIAPRDWRYPHSEMGPSGYGDKKLAHEVLFTLILMIAADNALHLVCNRLALR